MSTVEEVAKGLSQVMADKYDGAMDDEGNPLETGLKRGTFDAKLTDKRVNDGFGLSLNGNILVLNYEGEVSMKELKDKNFEGDVEQTLADVLKFVKKHYKRVTGENSQVQAGRRSQHERAEHKQSPYLGRGANEIRGPGDGRC